MVAVTNSKICEKPFEEQIKLICELKPSFIILREKDLSENEYEFLLKTKANRAFSISISKEKDISHEEDDFYNFV